jgi:hypothetical protein
MGDASADCAGAPRSDVAAPRGSTMTAHDHNAPFFPAGDGTNTRLFAHSLGRVWDFVELSAISSDRPGFGPITKGSSEMGNAPFPNPGDASDGAIVLACRVLAPLVTATALEAETLDDGRYLACVMHAVFQIVGGEARRRVDLALDDGLRELLDDEGGDNVTGE